MVASRMKGGAASTWLITTNNRNQKKKKKEIKEKTYHRRLPVRVTIEILLGSFHDESFEVRARTSLLNENPLVYHNIYSNI